ncbi:MAG: PIN domain-containing protein [Methanobrevibacter sp.]|nr:PIN domain-containing protein [Candidatus Methanovirga procula]
MFLEPSFIISFYAEKSNKHKEAIRILNKVEKKNMYISYIVIAEVLTVLRKINSKDFIVEDAYNHMVNEIKIIDDTEYYEESFKSCLDNKTGFFDNLYYILMKDLGIKNIITFDPDFNIFNDINKISNIKELV